MNKTKLSRENMLATGRVFLNQNGYEIDDNDPLWMEEYLGDHKFVDMIELFFTFASWSQEITPRAVHCWHCGTAMKWKSDEDLEDLRGVEGVVTHFDCPKCGADAVFELENKPYRQRRRRP